MKSTLKKLIDANLTNAKSKQKSKQHKKLVRKRREELKKLKKPSQKVKQAKKPTPSSNLLKDEIDALKHEIADTIDKPATYIKRQFRKETPQSWEGLTPGLAPVGYDPDESDEDPY